MQQTTHSTLAQRSELTEQLLADVDASPRTIYPAALIQPEGELLAGIGWQSDYRFEEEHGAGQLLDALNSDRASEHVITFADVNAIAFSTRPNPEPLHASWGDTLRRWDTNTSYADSWATNLPYVQGWKVTNPAWLTVSELRDLVRNAGIRPVPRRKDDLLAAWRTADQQPRHPHRWPAWFTTGQHLVLRADSGVTSKLLAGVIDAAKRGSLAVTSTSGPFSTGLLFYDRDDETDRFKAERAERLAWLAEQETVIAPIRAQLAAGGHDAQISSPRPGGWNTIHGQEDDATRWWVVASRPDIFGWFTAQQLADGSWQHSR